MSLFFDFLIFSIIFSAFIYLLFQQVMFIFDDVDDGIFKNKNIDKEFWCDDKDNI